MNPEYKILELLKENPMLMTELQKELGFTTNEIVGIMAFLEKYKLVETSVSTEHELMAKITPRGVQLLNLPGLPEDETTGEEITELTLIEQKIADNTINLYTSGQQVESIKGITAMATRFNTRNSDVIHAIWLIAKDSVWAKLEQDVKGVQMTYCQACRAIEKRDYNNPKAHFGTCQECGRNNRGIQQGYYENIPSKGVKK